MKCRPRMRVVWAMDMTTRTSAKTLGVGSIWPIATPMPEQKRGARRECGECTACCHGALRLVVEEQQIGPGNPCRHCAGNGCTIYASRPLVCQQFECGWLIGGSPLPLAMRPDVCGAVVLLERLRWRGLSVDMALPSAQRIPDETLRWLVDRASQNGRPLLYRCDDEWVCVGPKAFCGQVRAALERGEELW